MEFAALGRFAWEGRLSLQESWAFAERKPTFLLIKVDKSVLRPPSFYFRRFPANDDANRLSDACHRSFDAQM